MLAYLERVGRGKWLEEHAPACTCCGGKSIGWGSYERRIRLGDHVEAVGPFLVRRWRCKSCGRTFSRLPPFVLVLKRYAAELIQGVWEERVKRVPDESGRGTAAEAGSKRPTLERLAERWGLPCVLTMHRWLAPLEASAQRLEAELRRLLPQDVKDCVEEQTTPGERLLSLAQLATIHVPRHPLDRDRVPYHHVLSLLGRLQACNG